MKQSTIGQLGEEIAVNYLRKKRYRVRDRNFSKPWGEIDLACEKGGKTYFIEVKTRSMKEGSRPYLRGEIAVHPQKIKRLERAIASYLEERKVEGEWQLDLVSIDLDEATKEAHIRHLRGIF